MLKVPFLEGVGGYKINQVWVPQVLVVQDRVELADFDSATGWAALNTDTTGVQASGEHCLGTNSMEFDKVDGAAGTVFGAIAKTVTSVDCSRFCANDKIYGAFYVGSIADVAYALVRLGTDASNYTEWRLSDASITAAVWQVFSVALSSAQITVTGTGWDQSAVTYVLVGVALDAQDDTLANIRWDHLYMGSAPITS